MDNHEQRLSVLESWRSMVDITLGKQEVDKGYINKRFDTLESDLKELKTAAKNLNYTVWAAVLLAFVKFALGGGLAGII